MAKRKSSHRKQQVRRAPVTGNTLLVQRIIGIFLLGFIVVFLGILAMNFFRGHHQGEKVQVVKTPMNVVSKTAQTSSKPKYNFYQDLQKRNAEVQQELQSKIKNTQEVRVNGKNYRIQIGAFRDKDSADRLRARMILRDYPVQVINNGQLYLVQVGPYIERDKAVNIQKRLRKDGIKDATIKAYVN